MIINPRLPHQQGPLIKHILSLCQEAYLSLIGIILLFFGTVFFLLVSGLPQATGQDDMPATYSTLFKASAILMRASRLLIIRFTKKVNRNVSTIEIPYEKTVLMDSKAISSILI